MIIKYFIPEDGDDQHHPNVFELKYMNKQSILLIDIKQGFPILGVYHFRFLSNIGSHIAWLDVADDQASVPFHNGSVFIKASRIESFQSEPSPVIKQIIRQNTVNAENISSSLLFNDDPISNPPAKPPKYFKETLLSFTDDDNVPVAPPNNNTKSVVTSYLDENDLLGMGSSSVLPLQASSTKSAMNSDFFGMDATLQPTKGTTNQSPMLNPILKTNINSNFIQSNSGTSNTSIGIGSMNPMTTGGVANRGVPPSVMGGSSKYGSSGSGIGSMKAPPAATGSNQYDPFNSIDIMSNQSKANNNTTQCRK